MTHANYLELFNYVLTHGNKKDQKSYFDDVYAWHEVDGYTCYLEFQGVKLTLLFHSRVSFEHDSAAELAKFQNKLASLYQTIQQQRQKSRN